MITTEQMDVIHSLSTKDNYIAQLHLLFCEGCKSGDLNLVTYLLTHRGLQRYFEEIQNEEYAFFIAVKAGQLNIIQYFIETHSIFNHMHPSSISKTAKYACQNNHPELLTYLLTVPSIEHNEYTSPMLFSGLCHACEYGYLSIVSVLVNCSFVDSFINLNNSNLFFVYACMQGHEDIVSYLLKESPIKNNILADHKVVDGLKEAINKKHSDIIVLFLSSPDIKKYLKHEEYLDILCREDSFEFAKELIMNNIFTRDAEVHRYLLYMQCTDILQLFRHKELAEQLNHELLTHTQVTKKNKI